MCGYCGSKFACFLSSCLHSRTDHPPAPSQSITSMRPSRRRTLPHFRLIIWDGSDACMTGGGLVHCVSDGRGRGWVSRLVCSCQRAINALSLLSLFLQVDYNSKIKYRAAAAAAAPPTSVARSFDDQQVTSPRELTRYLSKSYERGQKAPCVLVDCGCKARRIDAFYVVFSTI